MSKALTTWHARVVAARPWTLNLKDGGGVQLQDKSGRGHEPVRAEGQRAVLGQGLRLDPEPQGGMQETSTRTSLAEGMSLYGLKDSELFWDKGSDTKMLMAWNRNTMVCSFRGTASLTNAMSDLKVQSPRLQAMMGQPSYAEQITPPQLPCTHRR